MSESLKPCPFCGGEAHMYNLQVNFYPFDRKFRVVCDKCNVSSNLFKTEQEARNSWNRRAD